MRAIGDIPSLTRAVGAAPTSSPARGATTRSTAAGARRRAARAAPRHRSLSSAARRSAGRSELGGVALLQRAVARPKAVGVHLVHRRRATSATDGQVGRPGARHAARAGPAGAPLHERRVPARDVRFSTQRRRSAHRRRARRRAARTDATRVRAYARERRARARRSTLDLVVAPAPVRTFPGAALASGDRQRLRRCRRCAPTRPARSVSARRATRVRRRAGVSRPQLGRVARRDLGVGRGARRRLHLPLRPRRVRRTASRRRSRSSSIVVDRSGFLALFRPRDIRYVDGRTTRVGGVTIRTSVDAREMVDVRGDDTLRIDARDRGRDGDRHAHAGRRARRRARCARDSRVPYFVQMKGTATISGRIRGTPLAGRGAGFFETYR